MITTPPDRLTALIEAWEQQQDAYVNRRSQRFGVILDALEYARPDPHLVLDIGGGLGSFSKLLLDRFARAKVVTLDYDPAMLELARLNLRGYGERSVVIEANLIDGAWPETLGDDRPDVVVSSTALHWLPTDKLVAVYQQLAGLLAPGALFFNADHLSSSTPGSFFHTVSTADDARQQRAAFSLGVPDWDAWWDRVRAVEALAEQVIKRDRRFSSAVENLDTTPALHLEVLRVAGFRESGTLWQLFDDYVVYGVR